MAIFSFKDAKSASRPITRLEFREEKLEIYDDGSNLSPPNPVCACSFQLCLRALRLVREVLFKTFGWEFLKNKGYKVNFIGWKIRSTAWTQSKSKIYWRYSPLSDEIIGPKKLIWVSRWFGTVQKEVGIEY